VALFALFIELAGFENPAVVMVRCEQASNSDTVTFSPTFISCVLGQGCTTREVGGSLCSIKKPVPRDGFPGARRAGR
jgi:hypothetical protein